MKQKLQKIVVGLCVLAGALGLAACGHEHAYTETVTAPTCTTQGYTTYTCECGESYVGAYVEELGHEFKQYVSDGNATCEADGTKTAVCARSGCKETDTVTVENSALGHEFKQYVSDGNATCEADGTKTAVCVHRGCKETDTVTVENSALGHEFKQYVSDNNATFEQNATKTAICSHSGCTEMDTVEEIGTMLDASLYFTTDGDTITRITYYSQYSATKLVLPSKINGVEIKKIDNGAFAMCVFLTSITLPDGVTTIGEDAFQACYSLTSITIPDSVTSIGDGAFQTCYSLTSITIPDSVTSIGDGAFSACYSLTSITVEKNNVNYQSIDGNLYSKDGKTLMQYAVGKKETSFVVPDGVTTIGEDAFSACYSLTSITIPDSVTTIWEGAFYNCSSLTSIEIPDGVTTIGPSTFSACYSLTSITIPDSVTTIWEGAFYNCSSLTSITIPDSVTTIGPSTFYACDSLTSVYYQGTAEEWAEISIGYSNDKLESATRYYYSETQPTETGNYWHYDKDGNVVVW